MVLMYFSFLLGYIHVHYAAQGWRRRSVPATTRACCVAAAAGRGWVFTCDTAVVRVLQLSRKRWGGRKASSRRFNSWGFAEDFGLVFGRPPQPTRVAGGAPDEDHEGQTVEAVGVGPEAINTRSTNGGGGGGADGGPWPHRLFDFPVPGEEGPGGGVGAAAAGGDGLRRGIATLRLSGRGNAWRPHWDQSFNYLLQLHGTKAWSLFHFREAEALGLVRVASSAWDLCRSVTCALLVDWDSPSVDCGCIVLSPLILTSS
jgi:hypothetical protein